jgi:hypothetical protein
MDAEEMKQTYGWTPDEIKEAYAAVMQRATSDTAFRASCLADPAGAVRSATGKALPTSFKLRFVANDGADITLVLPDPAEQDELSDRHLARVAGGKGGPPSHLPPGQKYVG